MCVVGCLMKTTSRSTVKPASRWREMTTGHLPARIGPWLGLFSLLLAVGAGRAQFVSFNDHAPGTGTAPFATTWNIVGNPPGSSGALQDIISGTTLPVTVTITRSGTVTASPTAANPSPGTPLYNTFNGFVDFLGAGDADAAVQVTGSSTVTYTFSGLKTNRSYSFKGSAVRGGVGSDYPQRWSLFQLGGAVSFASAHTAGGYTNGLAANQVAINTGVNTNGDMADWESIVPGANGSFAVTTTQYTGPIPAGGTANGPYCYALSGFRLQEFSSPAIVSAANIGDNVVQVVFSIPVQASSATNVANYSITNLTGNVALFGAAFVNDNKTIQLTTASQTPFAAHWLTVNGVADAATGSSILTNAQVIYTNLAFTAGYIQRQLYFNLTNTLISTLTNSPKYPNNPDQVDYPPSMGWPLQNIADNYGGRFSGLLVPPITGQYYFAIRSDDASQLTFSTNENPASATLLAVEPSCCEGFDAHTNGPITLVAGQRYYIEALMKEGGGSDYLYVAWKMPTNLTWTVIPGSYLGEYLTVTNSTLTISQQPTNTSVVAGQPATFRVAATGTSSVTTNLSYQWQSNGFDISGATYSSFTILARPTNNGAVYRVLVAVPGKAQFSSNAVLTVTPDTVPPTVVRAFNIGPTNVQVVFSEPVEGASATNTTNYVFTGGVLVTGAALDSSNTNVTLTTSLLVYGSNYSIVINRVRDQAAPPNTIASNTLVSFLAMPYAPQDIGNPTIPSTVSLLTNGVNVTAAGNDIGGAADQFGFSYQLRAGDFDVSTRLAGLGLSDLWAKAGLLARETLDPSSRFAAALASPSMNGAFFEYRDPAYSTSIWTGSFPANYPNTWLRLKRAGNQFTAFASYDGQTWTQLGSVTITMPSQIYFGLAVSSHNGGQTTLAQFRDLTEVGANALVGVIVNPHEPLGPSARKSGIVISEIMYKPAPRIDGRNLEFLEIYNSTPFFHDISSYQIVSANMSYTFPSATVIPAGAFFVIAAVPADVQSVYGIANVFGPYTGSLKKSDTLQLLDEQGAVLLTVPYSNVYPWPVAADGSGHSIVLASPTYGEEDPRAWDISDIVGGSPGTMESFRPSPLRSVMINELVAHSENTNILQFIELYNHSNQTNDLSGCILTDDPATNKFLIPQGTLLLPRGFVSFDQTQLGFSLNALGETVYLIKPDGSRVLDAVQFEAQANGVSFGRWPDGANAFYPLASPTPGASNSVVLIGDVVINELMYNPISGSDDDQYVELYNKGSNTLSLAKWQFTAGIGFTFPTNVTLAPDSYLVIARNPTNLFAKYPNLNSGNTLGSYSGKLSHNGERVALAMPQSLNGTNTIYVVEDEVTFSAGGRWGQWSSGGGSSLELIDPRSNHRLAANWGDSDETHKSSWTNIETTGVLDNGHNYDASIDYAQIGILDVGECLVDNIEVHPAGDPTNYVSNPDFENGLTNWIMEGDHIRSTIENEGYASSHSLHVRCSDRIWTGDNSCEVALTTNSLVAGQSATLRFKARWLRGWPEVLFRLNGNWLEATGPMPIPANLGTPGARNSRYVTNAGPAIYEVTHAPAVPAASQAVVVTARAHDSGGLQNLTLNYRIDPSTSYTALLMKDDGTAGDAIAGDGLFSATIPGQNPNTIVAFYISATDAQSAATRFPALLNDNAPVRECVVMFGDGNPGGSFGVYHLWITQTNVTRWSNLSDLSNESFDCTMVNANRVIYDAQARFAGSPYHQGFNTPNGNLCHYKWIFPEDDKFLGATSFNKIHQPGNGAGDDTSIQREQAAYTFLRALGVPWLNRRYVAVYVNGSRRGTLMEDTQCPDGDVVKEHYPNDADGWLYKMQPWFEFGAAPKGSSIVFHNDSWCNLMPYTTTGGVKKTARYRYCFESRRTPVSANDFTNAFSLIDAANSYGTPNYEANMQNIADMENWMRVFAGNHAAGNWDSFGAQNSQNLYGYIGQLGTKYSLLMWDFNIVLGNSGSWGPGANLFTVNGQDPNMSNIYNTPVFRRMYWRALQELVNGPLTVANSGPLLDAKYTAFVANNLNVEDPNTNLKSWLTQAHDSIASQLAAVNPNNFTVNPSVPVTNDVAYVSGTAPVLVKTIWFNGAEWPVTWTTLTNWTVRVPLRPGANTFTVLGVDMHSQLVPGASNNIAVIFGGTVPSPVGQVVLNEIMYNPSVVNSEFVELYNTSSNIAFDLSGCQLRGLGYTFPPGSGIGPNGFLVLAANRAAFAAAYGATNLVFDTFAGTLPTDAGLLSLVQPGTNSATDLFIAQVRYGSSLPWSAGASGTGSSLQLLDPHQDNWRVGNWTATFPPATSTPDAANSALTALPPFPPLWINELQADNLTGITNSAGLHTPWLELYNPSTNVVPLTGLYLANTYTNLTAWAFPAGAVINPGQFKIIFADSQTGLSTSNELHASFTLSSGNGSLALSRIYNSQPQVLDFLDYAGLGLNHSLGSVPDGQSFYRQEFSHVTPGTTNDGTSFPSSIPYTVAGSVYAQDFNSLPNPGLTSVNSGNPVTINGITYSFPNPYDFAFPAISSGQIGGLGLPPLAGWYGLADSGASVGARFGATDGDQTTGGQISFGLPGSTNRALGLLATSSTGFTAFGAKFINRTAQTLHYITLRFTGEVWRQSDKAKTLQFYYLLDPAATSPFSTNNTAFLPGLNVAFPTVPADVNGVAVDGTAPANQTSLSVTNQLINSWPPGAALWLVWEMADPGGKSQGLAIDNLSFSAVSAPNTAPMLAAISNRVVTLGQTLAFTASATDTDQPPQTLTFSLGAGAPGGAAINSGSGQFSWKPSSAPNTNSLSIIVADNGAPSLSATQTFTVTVYLPPQISSARQTGSQFIFSWQAPAGQMYQVEYKNDLSVGSWTPIGNPLTGSGAPLSFTNGLSASIQRFFRLRILP